MSLSDSPRARERQRRDLSRNWLEEGRIALHRGNLSRAFACFTSARSLDGGSKEIAFYAAWLQFILAPESDEPLQESVQNLARATLLENPQHAFAHYVTGELARRNSDSNAARRSLRIAIQLDPELDAARVALNASLKEQSA